MPIYEYKCDTCNYFFEMLLGHSEQEPTTCPKCGSNTIFRALSAHAVGTGHSSKADCPSCPGASAGGCSTGMCPMMNK